MFTDRFVWKCKIERVTRAGASRGEGQRKSEKEHESVRKCENVRESVSPSLLLLVVDLWPG